MSADTNTLVIVVPLFLVAIGIFALSVHVRGKMLFRMLSERVDAELWRSLGAPESLVAALRDPEKRWRSFIRSGEYRRRLEEDLVDRIDDNRRRVRRMLVIFGIAIALLLYRFGSPALGQPVSAAELTDERIDVGGTERRYLVHDFSGGKETALVLVLHGGGGSGENAASQTGFDRVAEREGLIAVYPYGSGGLTDNLLLTWNAGHCCAYAMREQIDDVAFISALIDELIATRSVDPARVYVTGLSNGGMMSHRLGRELPEKIAAIAPVIASLFGDETPAPAAMPVLIVNGAEDSIVTPGGGPLGLERRLGQRAANSAADAPTLPIASQAEYWAEVNACADRADSETDVFTLTSYASCRTGAAVQHYVIKGSGHSWPGGTAPRAAADVPVDTIDINELIWSFFSLH